MQSYWLHVIIMRYNRDIWGKTGCVVKKWIWYTLYIAKGSCAVLFSRVEYDAITVKIKYFKENELEATDTYTHDPCNHSTHSQLIFYVLSPLSMPTVTPQLITTVHQHTLPHDNPMAKFYFWSIHWLPDRAKVE